MKRACVLVMSGHVFSLKDIGSGNRAGADDEEGGLDVNVIHEVEQVGRPRTRSIVVTENDLHVSLGGNV